MKLKAWSALTTPPEPKISPVNLGLAAVSAHFFKANGLKREPQAPPKATLLSYPTLGHGFPSPSGSIKEGIVLVKVTPAAPPS